MVKLAFPERDFNRKLIFYSSTLKHLKCHSGLVCPSERLLRFFIWPISHPFWFFLSKKVYSKYQKYAIFKIENPPAPLPPIEMSKNRPLLMIKSTVLSYSSMPFPLFWRAANFCQWSFNLSEAENLRTECCGIIYAEKETLEVKRDKEKDADRVG